MNFSYHERLDLIQERIQLAARRARRLPESITLIAVSKTQPPEAIAELARAGQIHFGENRVQEAKAKIPCLPGHLQWHLVGHLQKNKIRHALPLFGMIHSIDSVELGEAVDRVADEMGLTVRALIEVNVGEEGSKIGFSPDDLPALAERLFGLRRLEISGLMCVPPAVSEAEHARPFFRKLRLLRDDLEQRCRLALPDLSMGMSNDFEVAVEEGASHVRVGTALFGERVRPPGSQTEE